MRSDQDLVHACRRGDRRAWEQLIHRYRRLIFGIPLRCGLGEDDAEDVFQQVCMILLEHLDGLKDEKHLTGWLITTTRRESWRVSRSVRRSAERLVTAGGPADSDAGEDRLELLPSPHFLPETELQRLTDAHLVRQGLEYLGERCRTLLGWLYDSDPPLPYAEIAERMNVSLGAVGPTRARCLEQLGRRLRALGFQG